MNDIGATIFAAIFMIILFASPIILVIVLTAVITTLITKKTQKSKSNTIPQKPKAPPTVNSKPLQNTTIKTNTIPQIQTKTNIKKENNYYNYPNNNYKVDKERIDEYYDNQYLPYKPKYLLTKNELNFYQELNQIAKEKNLVVLSKIRMADLVEVEPIDKYKWDIYFNRISRKHIDFALARPENLKIELLIELDDYTHNESQYERDRFIEAVYKKTGYKLLRTRSTANLRELINEIIT